ncbi:MAG: aminomethyltransferase [Gammaproteobacteria bacterium]|nr:MAG: aminomethyltransferase [Gammaproteobacteria bacterium]
MRDQAKVVIIGGGIVGVSLLYALAREGWKDVVLVEKGELTSGSTWHAAGIVPVLTPSLGVAHIYWHSIKTYRQSHHDPEIDFNGWRASGGARLAVTERELQWCRHVASMGASVGFDIGMVSREEVEQMHPHANVTDALGAVYSPHCCSVDPAMACHMMAKRARLEGAEISLRNRVIGLTQTSGDEWLVETEKGTIRAQHVVNSAGCYAKKIARMAGTDIPLVSLKHQYFVTDELAELDASGPELPILRDSIVGGYYRQEQKSMLIGPWEFDNIDAAWGGAAPQWGSENELFTDDLQRIEHYVLKSMERLPFIANAGVKTVVNGAIPFTPDGNPLMGPAYGLRNFWHCCGSNIGIAQGPGMGHFMAQQMIYGDAEINMLEFDPRRFGTYATEDYAFKKAVDVYSHYARPAMHGESRPAGRPARVTPIYREQQKRGAIFMEAHGWERPRWFSLDGRTEDYSYHHNNIFDVVGNECRAVRERVGIMDISSFSKFEVSGVDAAAFMDRVCANKLPASPGRIGLTQILNESGRVFSEMTITRLTEYAFYLISGALAEVRDQAYLARHRGDMDVTIKNLSSDMGALVIAGPRSRDLLAHLTLADLTNASFKWLTMQEIDVAGIPVRALRVNYVGELGWELHVAMDRLADLYAAVLEAGAAYSVADFGAYAMNSLRLEKAYHGWGHELTNELNLIQAGMERFVDTSKSFIGLDATLKAQQDACDSRIVYCEVDIDDADALGGESCRVGEKVIGLITSGGYGHCVGKALAFAWVENDYAHPGAQFDVDILGRDQRATVLAGPAYDALNEAVKI